MRFDVFGRTLLLERTSAGWEVFFVSAEGKRRQAEDLVVPQAITEEELEQWLFDLCHEWATPKNLKVSRID